MRASARDRSLFSASSRSADMLDALGGVVLPERARTEGDGPASKTEAMRTSDPAPRKELILPQLDHKVTG